MVFFWAERKIFFGEEFEDFFEGRGLERGFEQRKTGEKF